MTKEQILKILEMPDEAFQKEEMPKAREVKRLHDNTLYGTAMLGYTNICRNQCLYCGMRASNRIPRFSLPKEDVLESVMLAKERGFTRVFLISGEDPKHHFADLLWLTERIAGNGMRLSLACGEHERSQFRELADAGAAEYVIKFEMSQKEMFDYMNPSTTFEKRMAAIEAVKDSGMDLASGNIIDYPGQTREMIAQDILLMKELEISWAPVVPYMPTMGTPLQQQGAKPGSRILALKEIAVLRQMMPDIRITAQQPGDDLTKGLADAQGNLDAIAAGADILFCDLLPEAKAQAFRVVDDRKLKNEEHLHKMADESGMTLSL